MRHPTQLQPLLVGGPVSELTWGRSDVHCLPTVAHSPVLCVVSPIFATSLERNWILLYQWQTRAPGGEVSCPECLCKRDNAKSRSHSSRWGLSAPSKLFYVYIQEFLLKRRLSLLFPRSTLLCVVHRAQMSGLKLLSASSDPLLQYPSCPLKGRKLRLPFLPDWVRLLSWDFKYDAHIFRVSMSRNPTSLSHSSHINLQISLLCSKQQAFWPISHLPPLFFFFCIKLFAQVSVAQHSQRMGEFPLINITFFICQKWGFNLQIIKCNPLNISATVHIIESMLMGQKIM